MADRVVVLDVFSNPGSKRRKIQLLMIYTLNVGDEIKNVEGTTIFPQPTDRMEARVKRIHDEVGLFTAAELAGMNNGRVLFQVRPLSLPAGPLDDAALERAWQLHDALRGPYISGLREKFRFIGLNVVRP